MAQRTVTIVTCDLHADDTEGVETIPFSIDGASYEMETCEAHGSELRETFAIFISHARRLSTAAAVRAPRQRTRTRIRAAVSDNGSSNGSSSGQPATPPGHDPAVVRQWAITNGHKVPERGRMSKKVLDAYAAANS